MTAVLLAHAESLLLKHDPATFDSDLFAGPECIEAVRVVEDDEA